MTAGPPPPARPAPRQVRNRAALEAFWQRVRALTPAEISALAAAQRSLGGFNDAVPVAFESIAGIEYANWAYLESMSVFHTAPAFGGAPIEEALFADVAVAAKGAAIAARHRLTGHNLDILEAAWSRAGLAVR